MAPEQVQGRSIDRRVDVWAFGVLLYEMVTGERPFRRESAQETFAAVLTVDPEWARVSPAVRALLRACLERDPLKRLRDIANYRFLLAPSEAVPARTRQSTRRSSLITIGAIASLVLAFFAGKSLTRDEVASAPPASIRLSTMLPAGVSVTRGPGYTSSVAISPDGRTVIIAARVTRTDAGCIGDRPMVSIRRHSPARNADQVHSSRATVNGSASSPTGV
jgi:serine/threonine protein kinase